MSSARLVHAIEKQEYIHSLHKMMFAPRHDFFKSLTQFQEKKVKMPKFEFRWIPNRFLKSNNRVCVDLRNQNKLPITKFSLGVFTTCWLFWGKVLWLLRFRLDSKRFHDCSFASYCICYYWIKFDNKRIELHSIVRSLVWWNVGLANGNNRVQGRFSYFYAGKADILSLPW